MKILRAGFFVVGFVVAIAPCLLGAADPFAEGVRSTEPLAPEEQQKTFKLPPGFKMQLIAAEPNLRKPMNMAFDAAGRLWITESREYPFAAKPGEPARDTIRIFSEFDGNGRAQKVTTFATNLNIPIGIYPFRSPAAGKPGTFTWKCIAWSIPNIWLFEDTDGDGVADKKEILFGPFDFTRDTHGNQASFRRGSDGWVYATHGFNNQSRVKGRDGHEIFLPSGNIYRFRIDGSRLEHWTHGQVNPFGLCFDPLGNLYSADCHSSPIYQLLRGVFYPSFGRPHDGLGYGPTTIQHSHGSTAIAGIVYISDPSWPAEYQNNIFIGNVMTSRINRDQITFHGSSSRGREMPDFLSTTDPWFRPVDLQFGPDGALYVADFYNRIIGHYEVPLTHPGRDRDRGRLWRIVPPGDALSKERQLPDFTKAGSDELIDALLSNNPTLSILAREELAIRGSDRDQKTLLGAAKGEWHFKQGNDNAGLISSSLWLLERAGKLDDTTLIRALGERHSGVRVHAARIATDRGLRAAASTGANRGDGVMAAIRAALVAALGDSDAFVQRAAADALAANPNAENVAPLLALQKRVPAEDTHLTQVVRLALREQLRLPGAFASLANASLASADAKAFASVASGVTNAEAGTFLLRVLPSLGEPTDVAARYVLHASRYAPTSEMGAVAAFAKGQFGSDVGAQAVIFKSVIDGFAQRGEALPNGLREWGGELAAQLLVPTDTKGPEWTFAPLSGAADSRNPWALQERTCSDGAKAQVMSSLPLGETLTGTLRSAAFTTPKKISFFLCGHDGQPGSPAKKKNVVRLRDAATAAVLRETFPPRNDTAQRVTWDLAGVTSAKVYFEATDGDDGKAYAWLAFGRFDPALPELAIERGVAALGNRRAVAAEIARALKLASLEPQLAALLPAKANADAESRGAVARALAAINPAAAVPAIGAALADANEAVSLREKFAAALAEANRPEATTALVAALKQAPARLQKGIALALAGSPGGAGALLQAISDGQASAVLLRDRSLADRLVAAGAPDATERIAKLTKNLPAADAAMQRLLDQRRAAFAPTRASAARGAEVFAKNCAVCHQIGGKGAVVGPQLDGIGGRGLERILEDVLDPNRNVDKAFRSTLLVLKDGEVASGLLRREEGATVVLVESTGKEISIPKNQIKERRESETSLMPANFGDVIPSADFNDLLAFLLGQTAPNASK